MTRPSTAGPDPDQVARTVAYLTAQDDRSYARSLGDMVMTRIKDPQVEDFPTVEAYQDAVEDARIDRDELAVMQAAFRSTDLLSRSLVAARFLLDDTNDKLRAGRRDDENRTQWQARERALRYFQSNIGRERRILEQILNGLRAQEGFLPNAPNPRQRAMEELARRHSKEFLQLVRFQEELQKRRRAEARRAAKQAAKEAKRGGTSPGRPGVLSAAI